MCLIIHKTPDVLHIDRLVLDSGFKRNNDGWGLMYAEENKIITKKGFDKATLMQHVEELEFQPIELFIHLRMATHGVVAEKNTHPFQIGNTGLYMMHNGVISSMETSYKDKKSDTSKFVSLIKKPLEANPELIFTEEFQEIINIVVANDRLVFLSDDGRFVKLGTGMWTDYQELHLSNTYAWDYPKVTTYYHNTHINKSNTYTTPTYSSNTKPVASLPPSRNSTSETDSDDFLPDTLFRYDYDDSPAALQSKSQDMLDYLYHLEQQNAEENEELTLEELLSLNYADLEYAIWTNPDSIVKALWNAQNSDSQYSYIS